MALGDRIKELRKHLGLTQREFGERIGVKQNTIALLESGKRNASDQLLLSICREFHSNNEWLVSGEGEMFSQFHYDEEFVFYIDDILEDESTDFRRRLFTALCHLSKKQWEALESAILQISNELSSPHQIDEVSLRQCKPIAEWSDSDIDDEVEDFRRRLLLEKRQADTPSPSSADGATACGAG